MCDHTTSVSQYESWWSALLDSSYDGKIMQYLTRDSVASRSPADIQYNSMTLF